MGKRRKKNIQIRHTRNVKERTKEAKRLMDEVKSVWKSKAGCHTGNILVFSTGGVDVYGGGSSRNGCWYRMDPLPDLALGPSDVVKRDVFSFPEGWAISKYAPKPPVIIIDFHAEATSEKVALGRYLDGRVSAVLGTHTHVGTIDTQLLPQGTAYVTDIGMTGPMDSVIGDDAEAVINRFLTRMPHHLSVGKGKTIFNAVLVQVAEDSGQAISIDRLYQEVE